MIIEIVAIAGGVIEVSAALLILKDYYVHNQK